MAEPATPKPVQSDDDVADEPDTTPEETAEAVEEIEEADSAEPDDFFDGEEEVELDLADTDIGEEPDNGDDEKREREEKGAGAFDGVQESKAPDTAAKETTEAAQDTIPDAINSGAARLATVGLPDEFEHYGETKKKEDLRDEFEEVFEEFKLGDFGEEVAVEYLFVEPGQVDPLTGFTVSMVACTTMVAMMRPDSDEIIDKVQNKVER